MADAKTPAKAGEPLVEATVRRGTVVWGGGPFHEASNPRERRVHSGPGQKVTLPASTVARLRRTGVLYDPQTPEIPVGLGPNFNVEDGVQVRGEEVAAPATPAA